MRNNEIPVIQIDSLLQAIIVDQIESLFKTRIILKINLIFTHEKLYPYSMHLDDPMRIKNKKRRTYQSDHNLYYKGRVVGFLKVESFCKLTSNVQSIVFILQELVSNYLVMSMQNPNRSNLIQYMLKNLEIKDSLTYKHMQQVKSYAMYLGGLIGFKKNEIESLGNLASLHDIGKLAIPDSILKKPSKLTQSEIEIMQKHPIYGFDYLINFPEFIDDAYIAFYHHERWDGLGYPYGLSGKNIPIAARILAIADTFDAMTGIRLYREPLGIKEALSKIKLQAEKQFDPDLVNIFIKGVANNFNMTGA